MFSYKIATVNNTEIRITILWAVFVAVILGYGTLTGVPNSIADAVSQLGIIDLSVPITSTPYETLLFMIVLITGVYISTLSHEIGHTSAASYYGLESDAITLWLLGGAAHINQFDDTPTEEFAIAIAGPLVSGALCILFGISSLFSAFLGLETLTLLLFCLASINLFILAFNLLPIFPLDGGRIVRATLQHKTDPLTATKTVTRISQVIGVVAIIVTLYAFYLFLALVSIFILYTSTLEHKRAKNRHRHLMAHTEKQSQKPSSPNTPADRPDKPNPFTHNRKNPNTIIPDKSRQDTDRHTQRSDTDNTQNK